MIAHETEMARRVEATAASLLKLADDASARFGGLTREQLNWRPGPERWSVAQCFDHLIKVQSEFSPKMRALADGTARTTTWERLSPLSGLFGRLLVRALDPANQRKVKTVRKSEPAASELDAGIIARYAEHQRELVSSLRALPHGLDPQRTVITSPLSPIVTYSLADCFEILVVHGQRHFLQAQRVTEAEGFPR